MATAQEENKSEQVLWDIKKVREFLPHRYPFLFIDKVVEFVDGVRIVAIKNVSINEEYFEGHFPEQPVMPGVLMLEAIAQAGLILAKASSSGISAGTYLYLTGASDVKWRRMVNPGDTLRIEVTFVKRRKPLWIMSGVVSVDGRVVAEGTISAAESGE